MADSLRKFGKYFLLDLLAQGGMAEIYRARNAALDGGNRILAIKRILKSYSENSEFVAMFRSEIKTTSGFTHPNIVQVYDYGEEDGMLYIAMEWVDGKNLRQFISKFTELQTAFPVEASCYIVEQAARALAYAHSYKDRFSGKSLNIVHRDISPQNLLISYDGAVKVIDFGIAKAVTNLESTRAGVIKGKPSYLSPEQISGDQLDGRSDIFALGIVFWELLVGKKLFQGENDYAVLKLIENCGTTVKPPSLVNPNVPKELDSIVMRCLTKNREQRFASADEMQRALHKFVYQAFPDFNPTDLADYARDLFKADIVDDRKRLLRLNDKVERLLQSYEQIKVSSDAAEETKTATRPIEEGTETTEGARVGEAVPKKRKPGEKNTGSFRVVDFKDRQSVVSVEMDDSKRGQPGFAQTAGSGTQVSLAGTKVWRAAPANVKRRSSWATVVVIAAGLLLVLGVVGNEWIRDHGAGGDEAKSGELYVEGNVPAATVMIDGKVVASQLPAHIPNVGAGKSLQVSVSANGYRRSAQSLLLSEGESKKIQVHLVREDATGERSYASSGSQRTVVLRVNVSPPGEAPKIRLNGELLDISGVAAAPVDQPLEVAVERPGYAVWRKKFQIDSKTAGSEYALDAQLHEAKFGFLSIKTTPSAEAILVVDGLEERIATPFVRKKLPIGEYQVRLVNAVLGLEKSVSVRIEEDRFSNLEERFYDEPDGRLPAGR